MRAGLIAIGMCAWDRFLVVNHYPGPGEYEIVRQYVEMDGGTTSNLCHALSNVGVPTSLVSRVGNDREGRQLVDTLSEAGCNVEHVLTRDEPTDSAYIVVSGAGDQTDRTIYWLQGARPALGDQLPVDLILDHRWVLIDVDDHRLRKFLLDLPAHRGPRTRLIGTMTYLLDIDQTTALEHALRHDIVIGNERELMHITATTTVDEAVSAIQAKLGPHACRVLYVSRGSRGAMAIRQASVECRAAIDVDVVDTTGAGDAFAAGCVWGVLDGLADDEILARGNVLGGLACRSLGARRGLPNFDEATGHLSTGLESNANYG